MTIVSTTGLTYAAPVVGTVEPGSNIVDATTGLVTKHTNGSITIDLGLAESGSFTLGFKYTKTVAGIETPNLAVSVTVPIAAGSTPNDVAAQIQQKLNEHSPQIFASVVVAGAGNSFKLPS